MRKSKTVNWNTLFLTVGFSLLGWLGKELYSEVKTTHDTVLILKTEIVPRSEFNVQMSEIRTRLSAVEIDIQKLKDKRNNP